MKADRFATFESIFGEDPGFLMGGAVKPLGFELDRGGDKFLKPAYSLTFRRPVEIRPRNIPPHLLRFIYEIHTREPLLVK